MSISGVNSLSTCIICDALYIHNSLSELEKSIMVGNDGISGFRLKLTVYSNFSWVRIFMTMELISTKDIMENYKYVHTRDYGGFRAFFLHTFARSIIECSLRLPSKSSLASHLQ